MVLLATSAPDHRDATIVPVPGMMAPGGPAEGLLRNSAYLALRRVQCEVHGGTATLNGRLPTYFLKQMAQTIVAQMEGVNAIINHIEVGT